MKYLIDIFTSRNGIDFSMSKLIAFGASIVGCYEFIALRSADFTGFSIMITALIGSLAAKSFVDAK